MLANNSTLTEGLINQEEARRQAIQTKINQLQFLLGYDYVCYLDGQPRPEIDNLNVKFITLSRVMIGQSPALSCSVLEYEDSARTICVTAQQLAFTRLAKQYYLNYVTGEAKERLHQWIQQQATHATIDNLLEDNNRQATYDAIIDIMEEQGCANRGFRGFAEEDQILPDNFEQNKRRYARILLGCSLLLELAYTYLQYTASYTGWNSLVPITNASIALSVIGTFFDFFSNIWGILVDNDAITLCLQNTSANMNSSMQRIASVASIANDISFAIGGAGNALAFLALLDPLYTKSPIGFYMLAAVITTPIAVIGRQYYLAFNNKYLISSLNSLDKYLNAERADHDRFYERDIAIAISALPVIVFRSVGFGGIAVLVAMAFHITNGWVNLFIGLGATLVTAISILATRIEAIVNHWSNNKFAYLSPEEKAAAWNQFDYNKIKNTLLSFNTIESMAVALGLLFLTKFNPGMDSWIAATAGMVIVGIMCRAQILKAINEDALKTLEDAGIDVRQRAAPVIQHQINPLHDPVADDIEAQYQPIPLTTEEQEKLEERANIMRKVRAANLIFELKQKPYLDFSCANFSSHPFSAPAISTAVVAIAVISRGLGFLGYVDICNSILKPLTTITVDDRLQLIGLALIFAVSNMRNMFSMFVKNMSSNIGQKIFEKEITDRNPNNTAAASRLIFFPAVNSWSKSGLRKTVGEFNNTLNAEIRSLQGQLGRNPSQ